MVLEWVAECSWNRWPDVSGMGGRMFMESVAEWVWNTQMGSFGGKYTCTYGCGKTKLSQEHS